MKNRLLKKLLLALAAVLVLFFCNTVCAENIDPLDENSQYAYGENTGWFNFEPTEGAGVTVTDTVVTGYAWAENIGWVNLSPASYGGVTNDGDGNLGGYAWSENAGWIGFSCEDSGICGTVDYGVTIEYGYVNGIYDRVIGCAWGENIGWVNFDLTTQADSVVVTLIELDSFTAEPGDGHVTLKWKTASETGNAGYNVYRAETRDGVYDQTNDFLIPARGSPAEGASYEITDDEDVQNRQRYWYLLEDVDYNGVETFHGPVSATPRLIYGIIQN
ncbi:hypothetical protein ACFL43_00015 [Thermodesulfobacteriota bacterium]